MNEINNTQRNEETPVVSMADSVNITPGSDTRPLAPGKVGKISFEFPMFEEFGKAKRSACFSSLT